MRAAYRDTIHAPTPEPDKATWRDRAVCLNATDPNIFHPPPTDGDAIAEVINDYCDVCPVRAECLAEALAEGKQYGIRGGMGEIERTRLLRRDRGTECRHGHEYTAENTGRSRTGDRYCVTCKRAQEVRSREKRRLQRLQDGKEAAA